MEYAVVHAVIGFSLALLISYELLAISTQVLATPKRMPTISEAVWRATARWPWIKWVGTVTFAVLVWHFWWGLR